MTKAALNNRQSSGVAVTRPQPHDQRLASALFALALAMAMASLDMTAPDIAFPQMLSDLHALDRVTWVTTVYLLTVTTAVPIATLFAKRIGYRRCVVAGMMIFTASSWLAGAAPTIGWLILFRGMQGLGAGCLIGLPYILFRNWFIPAVCARWQLAFTGVFALSSVTGPTVGLWLLGFASWRWMFWINLPLMAVALILLLRGVLSGRAMRGWKPIV